MEEIRLLGKNESDQGGDGDSSSSSDEDFIEANFVSGGGAGGGGQGLNDSKNNELQQEPTGLLDC